MTSSERDNQTNSGWFHHQTEGVMIIKARPLMKTLGNQSSFVPIHRTIR